MRIVAISDTHNRHDDLEVPDGDVLVHAGDFSMSGKEEDVVAFVGWLEALPHARKVVIAGNHDWLCEREPERAAELFAPVDYLLDSGVTIDGVKFWGSPWQPWFMDWAFNRPRGHELAKMWAKIPDDTDVLITHGPPYGHGDRCEPMAASLPPRHVGCVDLLQRIAEVKPKLHVFGHIHEDYGVSASDALRKTVFLNASVCTLRYEPTNPPLVFDL